VECHSQENNGFKTIDYQALSRGFQKDFKGIPRGFQGDSRGFQNVTGFRDNCPNKGGIPSHVEGIPKGFQGDSVPTNPLFPLMGKITIRSGIPK
jgi:hypothetical protein